MTKGPETGAFFMGSSRKVEIQRRKAASRKGAKNSKMNFQKKKRASRKGRKGTRS
jgi:hypothetical protein